MNRLKVKLALAALLLLLAAPAAWAQAISGPPIGTPVYKGTFAGAPSASGISGALMLATDLGKGGCEFVSNGTNWKPLGSCVIYSLVPAVSHTGDTSDTALLVVTIPAALLGVSGSLYVTETYIYPNNANNKIVEIHFGATGTVSDTLLFSNTATTASGFYSAGQIWNATASSQFAAFEGGTVAGGRASNSATAAINTVNASFVTFAGQLGNAADTITLESATITLLP